MNTTAPSNNEIKICHHCRSRNRLEATACWMCLQPLNPSGEVVEAELVEDSRTSHPLSEIVFSTLLLISFVLLVLVALGIATDDAGMLIPFAIVTLPAILAAGSRYVILKAKGDRHSAMRSFLMFVTALAATIGTVIVLFVAAVVAMFVYCLYAIQNGGF